MPSGAKKRKAAKKKKEKEANIIPSSKNPQGNDELKCQDEKGSDGGGEGSSPAYHDHDDHQHPFNEGSEEIEERYPSAADAKSVEEVPSDVKTEEAVGGKEDSVVTIERDLKSEESSESKSVSVEHIESAKESFYANGNSIDTSIDESQTEKNSNDEHYNSIEGATICDELVKSTDSSPSKINLITENASVEETGNSAVESSVNSVKVVASVSDVKCSDAGSVLLEKSIVTSLGVTDLTVKKNEVNIYPLNEENARTSSLEEPKPQEYDSKVLASLSGRPFTESANGTQHLKDSATPECSENQPLVSSTPHTVQKTPWLSCCGLFEVLSGSNR